ncbi:hypothetical protein GCM10012284_18960 [Mangrovihabitans endophyticus]|uniref:Diguanylate cyclase (GGDEF) domain-containing protein n=1 Tax=Mangrovihabitans endophyticus TaxID=1751298 RepID=A0A8J3BZJ2_9ACTN|nr:hypothetical protein GCM10012284_18960 [Mangrovihabitans endophyticus]
MARPRVTPLLLGSAASVLAAVVIFVINSRAQLTPVLWGWLPAVLGTALSTLAAWRTAAADGLEDSTRRLWRSIALVAAFVVIGLGSDAHQGIRDPARDVQREHDPLATIAYSLAMVVLLWALLRIPLGARRQRERTVRFVLDALTVSITAGIFAWYFTADVRAADNYGSATVPMLLLATLGLIGGLALIKVATSGLAGLDLVTVRWLAAAAIVGAAGGAGFPMLVHVHPGISGAQMFVPATMFCVTLAADRQRRAVTAPRAPRRRRPFSMVPYAAVGSTDCLLLVVAHASGPAVTAVAVAAVALTALVAFRQFAALSENARLLRRVDAGREQLRHQATHDGLTGLANRALFERATREALAAMPADGDALCLALIDLDDFKAINDRLGHAVGDALLVEVGRRLESCVRDGDVVARLGGDEFGLLLHGLRRQESDEVLSRITEALNRPVHALGYDLLTGASVGLAQTWPGAAPQELLRRADLAMYAAKERGKGRHAIYDAQLEHDRTADAQLGAELRRALDGGEFSLVYQPIVRLPDGEWTGLETLVRWHPPGRDPVSPATFVPVAERTGLIVPLGDWIMRSALRQAAAWTEQFGAAVPHEIGVNVSARQLREPGFAGDVRAALTETGFDPERLVVEVTETAVFDGGAAQDTLNELVSLGVRVALDDFGTGHSSLGLLRTVPTDTLKVDKSFVDGIGSGSEEAVIATAMIQITDGLHLKAIAEGVETAEQAQTLHRMGYRFAQGYHFARPLSAEQITRHLAEAPATMPV